MHGHNYRMFVAVEGETDPHSGMIADFGRIKEIVQEHVLSRTDHRTLNDFLENPTAENVIVWIWDRLKPQLPQLKELRLWETPEYCVTYSAD
jgi:6-pyruvoyltetrahydropterin/6-carboxytetrahydropterin synthase